jgi:quercetin dioxygenase-like cupin family protein
MKRHRLIRREEIELTAALADHSSGLVRAVLVGAETGATHTGLTLVELEDGHVVTHLHSFETSFYVLSGEPVLTLDGRSVKLQPDACGAIPVGVPHAWRSDERSRWIEMATPCPRSTGQPPDTFFIGGAPDDAPADLDLRDPRNRNLFHLSAADMDVAALGRGSNLQAPTVSASMATAALLYSGITVKMLVDKRLDAQLHTMFMVGYQPGAVAHPHDHPFEEAYFMLEGEVEVVADGDRYTLRPGDVFWTAVGCIHAFYETAGGVVKWLETSAPGPPDRHSYRFARDWEYLAETLVVGTTALTTLEADAPIPYRSSTEDASLPGAGIAEGRPR